MSAGVVLVGCGRTASAAPDATPPTGPLPPLPPPRNTATPSVCAETHDNIEGPYYRAGAPERWDLTEPGMQGYPLELDGRVTGLDCAQGIRDVELDVWHATASGHHDNDGSMGKMPTKMVLRGRLKTEADGRYHVKTIIPGRYLNGPQYRPAHVHVKLRAPGFRELTTQLYFPNDPYNDVDPFIHGSLIMALEKAQAGYKGRFDFVLRPA